MAAPVTRLPQLLLLLARGQIFALSQKQIQFPAEQQIWLVESIELAGHTRGCCCLVTRLPNDFAELDSLNFTSF